ncbi:hypothetical protein [Salinimicrobium oceani]|uniref:Lipoprotein n=1 Tax=Salinimicrobium oceani TaxID=2722702 RepID=A0ABX1CVF0_9FLAO|nr:hypothetical protein [Salinimicrobium oceani]NJW51885.1 hypothetical protein [Salinimicrobium oceani]
MKSKVLLLACLMIFAGCDSDDAVQEEMQLDFSFNFATGTEGWIGGFSDYPAGEEDFYELEFEHSQLPEPLNTQEAALKLSGNNHSDDLFMYVTKQISGLQPNKEYKMKFEVNFASNVADGQFGIGGSPGESVYLKAGGASHEPQNIEDEFGWYRLNVDKGNQAEGGDDMMVIGNFANGTEENVYTLKTLYFPSAQTVMTNDAGELWLLFGVDSGFEGTTTIYINSIKIALF